MIRIVLGLFTFLVIAGASIAYWALAPEKSQSLSARVDLLKPHFEILEPAGDGPVPFVILSHGCGGLVGTHGKKDILSSYAEMARSSGYRAVIVDSFQPREIDFDTAIQQVCTGMKLRGRARAGDILAAYAYALSLPNTSETGHVIAGWSHGGWSVMELMTMQLEGSDGPASITGAEDRHLTGLGGVYLTYPYCGFPASADKLPWVRKPLTSVVLAEHDRVVRTGKCARALQRMDRDSVPLEVEVIEGVTHAFDESDQTEGSSFVYDESKARHALDRFGSYLSDLSNGAEFPNPDRFFVDVAGAEAFE